MKKDIHPKWFDKAKVTCNCGNVFYVGSTKPEIQVEICSKCHPFFTGEVKFIDTQGRVEKFIKRQAKADKSKKAKKRKSSNKQEKQKTLKEMLSSLEK